MATTKTNPKGRRKAPSVKQLRARAKFVRMVRARAKAARAKKRNAAPAVKRNAAKRPAAKRNAAKRPAAKRNAAPRRSANKNPRATRRPTHSQLVRFARRGRKRYSSRIISRRNVGRRRRRNSVESQFEAFQGRPVSGYGELLLPEGSPKKTFLLGEAGFIETNKEKIDFEPGEAFIVADDSGNLYVGTDRAANPEEDFEPNEYLGEIDKLSYITVKAHMENEEVEYVHKLGEEGGRKPTLQTDEEGRLLIIGGDYYIQPEGIRD